MLTDTFGTNAPPVTVNGATYYVKFGGWTGEHDYEEQCEAFFLPLDMELVILVSSQVKGQAQSGMTGPSLETWVAAAIANAIVQQPPPNA